MKQIDASISETVGLSNLSAEEKERLLIHMERTLHTRLGLTLSSRLSAEQLEEFNQVLESGSNPEKWLRQTIPDYDQLIEKEIDGIIADLKETASE